jgi:hypothetical protein
VGMHPSKVGVVEGDLEVLSDFPKCGCGKTCRDALEADCPGGIPWGEGGGSGTMGGP